MAARMFKKLLSPAHMKLNNCTFKTKNANDVPIFSNTTHFDPTPKIQYFPSRDEHESPLESIHLDDIDEFSTPCNFSSRANVDISLDKLNDTCPCVGQTFNTLDEAERFYRDYGKRNGFKIIIRSTHRCSQSKEIFSRLYICRKGGRECSKSVIIDDSDKGKRTRDKFGRTNCEARMYVVHRVKSNKWEITVVELEHDHSMVSQSKVQFMQRSKNILLVDRQLIELLSSAGIGGAKIHNIFGGISGGSEKVGFSSQDIRNVIRDVRHQMFDSGDAQSGLALLRELCENNFGNFFFRLDLDEENRISCTEIIIRV